MRLVDRLSAWRLRALAFDDRGPAIIRDAIPLVEEAIEVLVASRVTIGSALASSEVRRGLCVVERQRPRVRRVDQMGWFATGLDWEFRERWRDDDNSEWTPWRNNERGVWPGVLDALCVIVPIADADKVRP